MRPKISDKTRAAIRLEILSVLADLKPHAIAPLAARFERAPDWVRDVLRDLESEGVVSVSVEPSKVRYTHPRNVFTLRAA